MKSDLQRLIRRATVMVDVLIELFQVLLEDEKGTNA